MDNLEFSQFRELHFLLYHFALAFEQWRRNRGAMQLEFFLKIRNPLDPREGFIGLHKSCLAVTVSDYSYGWKPDFIAVLSFFVFPHRQTALHSSQPVNHMVTPTGQLCFAKLSMTSRIFVYFCDFNDIRVFPIFVNSFFNLSK